MTAPIDRIENVRAQVEDVERQMEIHRAAGVQFSPKLTWQLLSACKSLLGPTYAEEIRTAQAESLREAAATFDAPLPDGTPNGRAYNSYRVAWMLNDRADQIETGEEVGGDGHQDHSEM